MDREQFSAREVRLTLAVVALIGACGIYIRAEYSRAFPQASIDLRLSPAEITRKAEEFLRSRRFATVGFRQLTVFDPDETARLYLEREVGLERANRLMERDISVWRWRARWFRPPAKEELLVWLSPDGRVTGFEHIVEETGPGARLSHAEALAAASGFVSKFTGAPGRLVEDRLEQRPGRYDYLFTWEQEGFRAKEAAYRRTVLVQGDQIGRYLEFLYIPESWRRDFAAMRSRNELYSSVAQALWVPLLVAAVALAVQGLRRRQIPWRSLIQISGVVGILQIASQLNALPLMVDNFPTSSPYAQTLLLIVFQSLGAGVAVFFYVIVAGAAGEPLYRAGTGDRLSLKYAFTRQGVATSQFYRATVAGYGLAAAHFAFLVAFYLIGRRFGAWSPQDVQYSDLLSTALPWIYPIAIASMASASEEFWFRLLAIPLVERLARVRWLAVVIPAFVWGFLHANYPQQPAWIRGVEVGIIGVAAGFVMLRFGIVATLVWHYAIDAVLIGLNLFDSPAWFYRISAGILLIAVFAPLIVSVTLYRRNGGFVTIGDDDPPAAEAVPVEAGVLEQPVAAASMHAIEPRFSSRWLYGVSAAVAVAGFAVSPKVFGNWIQIRTVRTEAAAAARARVPDPAKWRASTDFIGNLDAAEFEYLRRTAGFQAADKAVREHKPVAVWRTRYYRPLEKEEWRIYSDQSGAVIRTDHLLDERAPGARLSAEEAKARAAALMPVPGMALVDWNEQRRENRTDYTLIFENSAVRWGDARARMSIELHGDEPSNFRRFLKLPEEWLREFNKPTLRDFAVPALIGSGILPLLIILVRRLSSPETTFHWRYYALAAGAALVCSVAANANQFASAMTGYDTATPEQNYVTQYVIARSILVVLTSAAVFAIALAADVFRQAAFGQAALSRPSLARTAAVAILLAGTARFFAWVSGMVRGLRRAVPMWNIAGLDTYFPGIHVVAAAYLVAAIATGVGAVLLFAGIRYMRPRRRVVSLTLLVGAIAFSRSLTVQDFAVNAVIAAAWLGVVWLIVETCGADLMGFLVAGFWLMAVGPAYKLMQQPSVFLRWNGVAAASIAVLAGMAMVKARKLYR